MKLRSEANISEHWTKKHKRRKMQQFLVRTYWNKHVKGEIKLPVGIKLIRQAPRTLDDDNLSYAFKWVRDAVADIIKPGLAPGRADENNDIQFSYGQEKSKTYNILISIEGKS